MVKPGYKFRNSPHNPVSALLSATWPGLPVRQLVMAGLDPGIASSSSDPGSRSARASLVRGLAASNLRLLELDLRAGLLELGLDLLGLVLVTPSLTGLGAPSTRSLASFRPRPVSARTSLITSIFLSPAAARTTVNSVFSSTARRQQRQDRRDRNSGSGGHAPLLFQHLGEVGRFQHGEAGEVVDDLSQISHFSSSFYSVRTNELCGKPHAASPLEA